MKMHFLKLNVIATDKGSFLSVLIIVFFAVFLTMPRSSKADFTSTDRLSPAPNKENFVDSSKVFAELTVINIDELSNMRGGFNIGGTDINIAAFIRTLIDGRVALESQLTVAGTGIVTSSTTATGLPGTSVISRNDSGSSLQNVTAKGSKLDVFQGGEGIVINDNRGLTSVINNVQKNRFLSTIINRASGRKIQHKVEIDVTIKNLRQLQITSRLARLTNRLSRR